MTLPKTTINDLRFSLISIFAPSADHPLQDVLLLLTQEGVVDDVALHALAETWTTPISPEPASTAASSPEGLAWRLKRAVMNALLREEVLAQQDLAWVLRVASDERQDIRELRRYAALVLGLLESHQGRHQRAYQHLLLALTSYQQERDDRIRARTVFPVLVWYLAKSLIHVRSYQQAHHLLTDVLETLTPEQRLDHCTAVAELYAQRGMILAHLRYPRRAVLDLNQAIRHDPENSRLYHVRGLIYVQQKAWVAAYHDLWRALHDDPNNRVLADELTFVLSHFANREALPTPDDSHR